MEHNGTHAVWSLYIAPGDIKRSLNLAEIILNTCCPFAFEKLWCMINMLFISRRPNFIDVHVLRQQCRKNIWILSKLSDWWQICGLLMRGNSFSRSANLFKDVNVIDIPTKWFGNFHRFELSRVNLPHRIRSQNWFELSGVSRIQGFEKLGVKL